VGLVVNFMRFPVVKIFDDQLAIERVRVKINVARFLWPTV